MLQQSGLLVMLNTTHTTHTATVNLLLPATTRWYAELARCCSGDGSRCGSAEGDEQLRGALCSSIAPQ